jgi:hypothetical protein
MKSAKISNSLRNETSERQYITLHYQWNEEREATTDGNKLLTACFGWDGNDFVGM